MTVVLDTSVLIDNLRGDPRANAALLRLLASGERRAASMLTKVEVLAGMRRGEEPAIRALFDQIEWIEVDDPLAEDAGLLAAVYRPSYSGIDLVDFVIAATTRRLGARLWTRNLRHFPMFEGLSVPY